MKKIILFLIAIFCISSLSAQEDFRKTPPKPGAAPKVKLGETNQFTLDNGLKVIVVENHKLPRVSFQLFVDVPMFQEKGAAGMSSLAGQLLKTGTTNRTKAEIDETVDFIGASLSTSSSGVFASALAKHKETILELMTDVLFNPSFPAEEFDKIKKQTISGLALNKDNPDQIASNVATVLRFGKNHPYGELTTEASVENVTLDMCKEYYNKYFVPNLSYLVIVGDVTVKEAENIANKYFASWKGKDLFKERFDTPQPPEETEVAFVNKAGAVQSVINITYPVELKPGSSDDMKANLVNQILGGGATSRLFQNLREDKGYTYGAYSSLSQDPNIGYFAASASVRNEVTDSALTQFMYELDRIRTTDIDEDVLKNTKAKLAGSFIRSLERPQSLASYALNTIRYKMPDDYYANYLQRLEKITAKELKATAQKYIKPENAYIVVVGNKDEVVEKLKPFDADGQVDFYDVYGTKLQPVTAALPEGLDGQGVIARYIKALGGADKLATVNDLTIKMAGEIQGQPITITNQQKGGKMAVSTALAGNVMAQQIFDGKKGVVIQMGAKQPIDGKQAEAMKLQAQPFPELSYGKMGVAVELKGLDNVDGKKAYEVVITRKDGSKVTEYFDAQSYFKIRSVQTVEAMGQTITNTTDFAGYKEVEGIQFPHVVTVSGMLPIPLKTSVESIEINKSIDDAVFNVE
jgi:predicted Zn-dependent peptidase